MQHQLVLDFGNTALKAAVFLNGELKQHTILPAATFAAIRSFTGTTGISCAILASVIDHPAVLEQELKTQYPLLVLNGKTALPVNNCYSTPGTLGYDRLAAVIGGWQLFRGSPVLAVVAGTCITYNVIDGSENFIGGAISPGLQMRAQAMHTFTSKLPVTPLDGELLLAGTSTETSLRSGVINGAAAEVEGMVKRYEIEFPGLKTVLTGGDAARLAEALKNGIFARPNLVAEGLNTILEFNVKNDLLQKL